MQPKEIVELATRVNKVRTVCLQIAEQSEPNVGHRKTKTYLISPTMIVMVMRGYSCDNLHAVCLGSCRDLAYVVRIYGGSLRSSFVDDEIGIVVLTDGDGDDLHGAVLSRDIAGKGTEMTEPNHELISAIRTGVSF